MENNDKLIGSIEASKYLAVSRQQVTDYCRHGLLTAVKVGRSWVISFDEKLIGLKQEIEQRRKQ